MTSTDPADATRGPASAPEAVAARAGVGSRILAFCIDLLVVHLLVAVVGLAATALTDGTVRVANAVVYVADCAVTTAPAGLVAAHGFGEADVFLCTRAIPGFVHDRMLVLREKAKAGEDDDDRHSVRIPVDDQGNPIRAFYVDPVIPLVLAAYLLLLEWRSGATPGKRVLGIRVQTPAGGPIGIGQAAKRLVRLIALMTASLAPDVSTRTGAYHRTGVSMPLSVDVPDLGALTVAVQLAAWAFIVGFVVMVWRRQRPVHDMWAGTEVVSIAGDSKSSPLPVAH